MIKVNYIWVLLIMLEPCWSQVFSKKPNIIIILADDLGYGDIKAYNPSSFVPTPNIDKLVEGGIKFTDGHSNSAVCTPTRYGVLTGRYSWRTTLKSGVLGGFSGPLIENNRMTVASLLKDNGYETAFVGKWHLGWTWQRTNGDVNYSLPITNGPRKYGFDYFFGISASLDMPPYVYVEDDTVVQLPTDNVSASSDPYWRAGVIAPDFKFKEAQPELTSKAVSFIDRHQQNNSSNPFFLYYPLTGPHKPHTPPDFINTGDGIYADMLVLADWAVKEITDALDRHNIADNTLIFFTSDNGANSTWADHHSPGHVANNPLYGEKTDVYEGGHRVPFVAYWPEQILTGRVSDEIICTTDFLATFAALIGEPLPQNAGEDSYSMLPVLLNIPQPNPIREATIHHSIRGMFSLRQENWKFIDGQGSGGRTGGGTGNNFPAGQLYDLNADLREQNNQYDNNSTKVSELEALLEKYKNDGRSTPSVRNDLIPLNQISIEEKLAKSPGVQIINQGNTLNVLFSNKAFSLSILDISGREILKSESSNIHEIKKSSLPVGVIIIRFGLNKYQTFVNQFL